MSAVAAESLKFLFLQNAQQLRLKFERDVPDFVQKERALMREFEPSRFLRDCSGECAFLMTKQFTFQKPERNGCAIQFHKSSILAAAQLVNCARDQFFAGSRLAQNENARICRRHYGHKIQSGFQSRTAAD